MSCKGGQSPVHRPLPPAVHPPTTSRKQAGGREVRRQGNPNIHDCDEPCIKAGRKLLCGGGGDGTEAHLPNPPLPLLGRRAGRGVWAGATLPAVPGGGGSDPNIHGSK